MKNILLLFCCLFALTAFAQEFVRKLDPGDRFEQVRDPYPVGDINNDKVADTAIAVFERMVKANNTIDNICSKGVCYIDIDLPEGIDDIRIEAFNIVLDSAMDVNGDGANEMLVYWWWMECCWVTLDMYTYKSGKWEVIATTKAFIGSDDDFKNRVIKQKGFYYLMGQKWNMDYSVIIEDKIKIK